MKKVLLSLLAVAALVLSCQNYDDEFAALNTKISSLESQITSLAELRTAVTGVQSSISALQTAVAAAQAAAEAADNSDAITALATSVSAIAADLVDLQTAIDGATTQADLDALKDELSTTLAALQTLIETNSASISSLILSNTELKDALEELGVDVDSVLAANATYEGNLTITNAAELAFAKSLGNKVTSVRGNVYVLVDETKHTGGGTGTGLTAADVNSVISQITFVVGNVKIDSDVSVDLSKLASVSGDYIVLNSDVSDDALLSVGGNVHFDYDGAYKSNIQTAGNIFLVAKNKEAAVASTSTPARLGTTEIDFMALTKATGVQTVSSTEAAAHTSGASVTYDSNEADKKIALATSVAAASTTSVKIGQAPVISITAGETLKTIELHYAADVSTTNPTGSAALASLAVTAEGLTSLTVKAAAITGNVTLSLTKTAATAVASASFPDLLSSGKIVSDAETTSLPKVKTIKGLTLSYDTSVSLPELTSSTDDIILTRATSFSAPKLTRVAAAIATGSTEAATAGKAITANLVSGSISFPELTKAGDVSFDLATSFVAPKAKLSSINLEEAEVEIASATGAATIVVGVTVDVLSVSSQPLTAADTAPANAAAVTTNTAAYFANPDKITTLILRGQDAVLDLNSFDLATSISYTGTAIATTGAAPSGTLAVGTDNEILQTLTLGGVIGTVVIDTAEAKADGVNLNTNTALTTINTSGTIASLTVQNNFDLTTLNALHTDPTTGTTAAVLVVSENNKLTTLKTGITTFSNVTITNNRSLVNLDLSSIVGLPNNWKSGATIEMDITGNYLDKATGKLSPTGTATNSYRDIFGVAATAVPDQVSTNGLATFLGMTGSVQAASSVAGEKYIQTGLATLSNFIDGLESKLRNTDGSLDDCAGLTVDVNYAIITAPGTSLTTTSAKLVQVVGAATPADTVLDEIAKLQ